MLYIYGINKKLWASLKNGIADRHENHRQFGLTLLDSVACLKNKKWRPETTLINGV